MGRRRTGFVWELTRINFEAGTKEELTAFRSLISAALLPSTIPKKHTMDQKDTKEPVYAAV
jgi:hypothetical protein